MAGTSIWQYIMTSTSETWTLHPFYRNRPSGTGSNGNWKIWMKHYSTYSNFSGREEDITQWASWTAKKKKKKKWFCNTDRQNNGHYIDLRATGDWLFNFTRSTPTTVQRQLHVTSNKPIADQRKLRSITNATITDKRQLNGPTKTSIECYGHAVRVRGERDVISVHPQLCRHYRHARHVVRVAHRGSQYAGAAECGGPAHRHRKPHGGYVVPIQVSTSDLPNGLDKLMGVMRFLLKWVWQTCSLHSETSRGLCGCSSG